MRIIIFFIGILTSFSFFKGEKSIENKHIYILPKSELKIKGKSNINKFTCDFNFFKLENPLVISYQEKENKRYFNSATLPIKNIFFDCGGRQINKDFHKLLNTKEFPQILIQLKEIEYLQESIKACIEMEIAGVSKTYTLHVTQTKENIHNILGVLELDISDFNLESPTKLLGIIVVSDIIEIDFNLSFKEV